MRWAPGDIPRLPDAALNPASFGFAAGAAVLAAVVCTVVPGWSAARMHLEWPCGRAARDCRCPGALANQEPIHSGAGGGDRDFAGSGVVAGFELSRDDVRRHRICESRCSVYEFAIARSGFVSTPGVRSQVPARFLQAIVDRLRAAPGVTSAAAMLLRPLEGTIGWDVSYGFQFETGTKKTACFRKRTMKWSRPIISRPRRHAAARGARFQ